VKHFTLSPPRPPVSVAALAWCALGMTPDEAAAAREVAAMNKEPRQ
jgi:hypothetical protein